jgi:hypothetical protein
MAQLISLNALSVDNVTNTGTFLFNVGRMIDIEADGSHCRIKYSEVYYQNRVWKVDHTKAAVVALATNYVKGTNVPLYILTKNTRTVADTLTISVDQIVKAWANPSNAAQTVFQLVEDDSATLVKFVTNMTLANFSLAVNAVSTVNLYQGVLACAGNPNYPAAVKDQYWKVSTAGLVGGGAGTAVEVGDDIICIASNAGGTQAAVGTSFMIVQRNMKPTTAAVLQTGTDNADFVTAKTLADQALTFGVGTVGFTGTITNSGTINATTFDTNVAAAGVTLSNTTLAADGTDAAIPITINAKGTGRVLINANNVTISDSTGTGAGTITSILNQDMLLYSGGGGAGVGAAGSINIMGGVGGATSGNGGSIAIKTGAAATDGHGGLFEISGGNAAGAAGNGGAIILTGGALAGTGVAGKIYNRSLVLKLQGAPTAMAGAANISPAGLLGGIITGTHVTGATVGYTTPIGADISALFPNLAVGDSFELCIINLSAALLDTITLTAGDGAVTIFGNAIVASSNAATIGSASAIFRFRNSGAGTWVAYRIS